MEAVQNNMVMSAAQQPVIEHTYKARILLTDDDPGILSSLSQLLTLYDYQVDTALGGQASIDKLNSNQYDLLLLDLKMPEVTGHDVMRHLSENNINILTIVVSGETSLADISKALRHGAYDYLKKPYVPEELTSTVNNAIRKTLLEKNNQQMQDQLNRSERLHRFIVNNSPDIIFILDNNSCFSFLNSKIESLLNYSRKDLIGKHISTIIYDDDVDKVNFFLEHIINAKSSLQSIDIGIKASPNSGSNKRQFELSLYPIADSNDHHHSNSNSKKHYQIYGTARDISERMEAEAFINFQAYHDLLTRLPNRALFKDRLSVAITQAQRNYTELAVMFIDLDRFKIINDSLGHTVGDRLLQAVSNRLQQCIRKGDTLSRFGGDEFTLLLPDVKNATTAALVADKILEDIKQPFLLAGREICVGASIGIAIYPQSGDSMDSLIKNADIAMYSVKNTGKDGYKIFNIEMHNASTERLMLEQDLRSAVDNEEIEICYQAQIDTRKQHIYGVEALIRWNHPVLGKLSPAEFIAIAEDSRLVVEIDKHTLRMACREVKHYHLHGLPDLQLAVNLSPLILDKDSHVDDILEILHSEQFPPSLLELEITENILMNDRQDVLEKLFRLSNAGIKLAIDDFGTGYSSLSYLQNFPVNTLKIDRSFISEIKNSADEACIVNAIVSMAYGLKLAIVAEGVETRQQLDYLSSLKCHIMQGYYFGEATQLQNLAQQYANPIEMSDDSKAC